MAALSQLSYSPEQVFVRHLNTEQLAVSRRPQSKVRMGLSVELGDRQEKALIEVPAVRREAFDLVVAVTRSNIAGGRMPARSQRNRDNVAAIFDSARPPF